MPDYEIRIWDAASIQEDFPPWVSEAVSVRKYAFAADFIRLYALYTCGGIYLDADVQVLGRFDPFLNLTSFMGREAEGDLEPAVMGAVPGQDWVKACLDYYTGRHFIQGEDRYDTRPLPIIIQDVLQSTYGVDLSGSDAVQRIDSLGLTIFPAEYFSPKSRYTGEIRSTRNTVAIHHFDGQWVEKNAVYYLKQAVHRFLIRALGEKGYVSVRNFIRKV